ncbi:NPCBM/NEW2 domain-containing protein [Rubinisphaera sp. JC750]|uniref:NPCBM/NEW2 domain-containing protein n=1 Tax=Rubinisphaera sp. JC750 TaxID=2898658 RepID=UPI001F352FC6|nr:NPCBM/NEW2 domain-containing protein [Rubinisphaera sp. JC750]
MKYWILSLGLFFTTADLMAAEVATLDGKVHSGEIVSISDGQVTLNENGAPVSIPFDRAMAVRWDSPAASSSAETRAETRLRLHNGSQTTLFAAQCDGRNVQGVNPAAGDVSVPHSAVQAVLFKPLDEKTRGQWEELLAKSTSDDLLVIRKGDTLDFLTGVVTEYGEAEVNFLYQGSEIPVKREKVFGLIHPTRDTGNGTAIGQVKTVYGDVLFVDSLSLQNQTVTLQVAANASWKLPQSQIREIDFSLGRVVYLSDLEPEMVEHTPFFDTVWTYQRDRTNVGAPLRLGGVEYTKGVWIHSKTSLTYRLAGDYTRLQAMIGIDDAVAANGLGQVRVQIKADDKVVFEEDVAALDAPRALEIDLTSARFLHILVDFGSGLDISDHLVLGDARLIK